MKSLKLNNYLRLCFICTALVMLFSCAKSTSVTAEEPEYKEYTIAVVLPYACNMEKQWHNVIDWSLENLNRALDSHQIRIKAEWYDEDKADISSLFTTLTERADICGVVGPMYSDNVGKAAIKYVASGKPLIPASATSEQLMRAFSSYDFLWSLTESDISQCEILLSLAKRNGAQVVYLLTDTGLYGNTFYEWVAFQGREMGLEINNYKYFDKTDAERRLNSIIDFAAGSSKPGCIVCVPTNDEIAKMMNKVRAQAPSSISEKMLFSDVAFMSATDMTFNGMHGVMQTYNPSTTFRDSYYNRYDQEPGYAASQFYDAVMLLGLAAFYSDINQEPDMNKCMRSIVSGTDAKVDWSNIGIANAVSCLAVGEKPHITGASGDLRFDSDACTSVVNSYYGHWKVVDGKRVMLEYTTSDNSHRPDGSLSNWHWNIADNMQNFNQIGRNYPERTGLNVLIVAGSMGWDNYRDQADALHLYQILKKNGVTDDQIILIAEDDLASNSKNPFPGVIRNSPTGENLYKDVQVDYHPSELDPWDVNDILLGRQSSTLTKVLQPGVGKNLLVYWVGHASDGAVLGFGNRYITMSDLADRFRSLSISNYRKALIVMECSFAGYLPYTYWRSNAAPESMLCFAATAPPEPSKATNFNAELKVWTSNGFSNNLFNLLEKKKDVSIYDVYTDVYKKTIGTHVSVYNADNFGNVYTTKIDEFVNP